MGRGGARRRSALLVLLATSAAVVAAVALVLFAPQAEAAVPARGTLVPGSSLGGIRLGDTPALVRARWGGGYTRCAICPGTTWLYMIRGAKRLAGVAVTFRGGRAVAVFTLGAPVGWRSTRGLAVGDPATRIGTCTAALDYSRCVGYGALSSASRRRRRPRSTRSVRPSTGSRSRARRTPCASRTAQGRIRSAGPAPREDPKGGRFAAAAGATSTPVWGAPSEHDQDACEPVVEVHPAVAAEVAVVGAVASLELDGVGFRELGRALPSMTMAKSSSGWAT